jgi:hypothetical protein
MPEPENAHEELDPFSAHARREPLKAAAVLVMVFDAGAPDRARQIANGLAGLLASRGRQTTTLVLPSRSDPGLGPVINQCVDQSSHPLVLITHAVDPWTAAHLDPLLEAVDSADHVLGRRPAALWTSLKRAAGRWVRQAIYASPVIDVHSPCRIHRRDALAVIPLQSESSYVDVEIFAKATFLTQLIQEVKVPSLRADDSAARAALWRHDRAQLLGKPRFRHAAPVSGPAKDPQRQEKGDERPSGQNHQGRTDLDEPLAMQNDTS